MVQAILFRVALSDLSGLLGRVTPVQNPLLRLGPLVQAAPVSPEVQSDQSAQCR